jgi:hypothetical protein
MMARMKLFALGTINRYAVLPTNALSIAPFSSTSHAQSYPVRYNTLCIQTTPSFSKRQSQSIHIVMPAVGVAKDASSTIAIVAISSLTSNVPLVGRLILIDDRHQHELVPSMNHIHFICEVCGEDCCDDPFLFIFYTNINESSQWHDYVSLSQHIAHVP